VLNLHYLPHTITAVVGDGADLGARVRYSWEQPVVLGTAGGPRRALSVLEADTFFIVNGDTLTSVDLSALSAAHASSSALVTLALVPNVEPLKYGGVRLGRDGEVAGFVPRGAAAAGSFHFVGVQIADRDAFAALPEGQVLSSIGGTYDALVANRPGSVRGFVTETDFWDIGTVLDYWRTSMRLAPAPTRTIVWDNVTIADGSVL